MIEAPSEPISQISSRQAFRACLVIPLAVAPPTREEWDPQANSDPRPSTQFFETALLRSRGFVLDVSVRVFLSLFHLFDPDALSSLSFGYRSNPTTNSPTRSTSSTIVASPTDPPNSSIEAVSPSSNAFLTDEASNGSTTGSTPIPKPRRVEHRTLRSRNESRSFVRSSEPSVLRRRSWRRFTRRRGRQGNWSGSSK